MTDRVLLVFGSGGQLGFELLRAALPPGWRTVGLTRDQADIGCPDEVASALNRIRPEAVINAAAYTMVDRAETEAPICWAINSEGPRNLAVVCAAQNVPLVHVSTDYVFDGSSGPYVEDDPCGPLNVYGASKLAGEDPVLELSRRNAVIRTSWVFGENGNNFVKTMLRLAEQRSELGVVADQRGKPTAAFDLASCLIRVAITLAQRDRLGGLYHFAGATTVSWFELARLVFVHAARLGLPEPQVKPLTTAQYPMPAVRPASSVLDCSKIERDFGIKASPLGPSLACCVKQIIQRMDRGQVRSGVPAQERMPA